ISTYIWILSNKKSKERSGKVQLIDASMFWQKMRKTLGSKRKEMSVEQISDVVKIYGSFAEQRVAVVFGADGKALSRTVVSQDGQPPAAPPGGKVEEHPVCKVL